MKALTIKAKREILTAALRAKGYAGRGWKVEAATNPRVPGEAWDLEDFMPRAALLRYAKLGEIYSVYVYYREGRENWLLEDAFEVEFTPGAGEPKWIAPPRE